MYEQRIDNRHRMFLYSESSGRERDNARRYLAYGLGHPDEGSVFDKKLGLFKCLFRVPVVNDVIVAVGLGVLQRKGYDSLMLELEKRIIGRTAFQTHTDSSLHIFAVGVDPEYQGRGFAKLMVERMIEEARGRRISRMRIGGGGHKAVNSIHDSLARRTSELRIETQEGNWVEILE